MWFRQFWPYLFSIFMGFGLFYLGWSQIEKTGGPFVDPERVTLVVRPANSETGWDGELVKDPDSSGPLGVRFAPASAGELTAQRASWGTRSAENADPGEIKTLRLKAPQAKLDPRTRDGTKISLSVLPDKKDAPRTEGYIRVEPGRYKFLATAEGFVPDSLDLELSAGELRKFTVDLKKIPKPPSSPPRMRQPVVSPPSYRPAVRPRPTRRPTYRPAARPRPPSRPQPRFTPVAPKPPERPVPIFTPFP